MIARIDPSSYQAQIEGQRRSPAPASLAQAQAALATEADYQRKAGWASSSWWRSDVDLARAARDQARAGGLAQAQSASRPRPR